MNVKKLDREATIKLIDTFKKRVEFNNELNRKVRKLMKEWGLDDWRKFNGYHDVPTPEMRQVLNDILSTQDWMSETLKSNYKENCGAIFGQVYGPHVNRYVLGDLHDLEKHLEELEKASTQRDEENEMFKVERDLATNRMNLYFEDLPDYEVRAILKSNGFRWSPYLQAWTRQLTNNAEQSLIKIKNILLSND